MRRSNFDAAKRDFIQSTYRPRVTKSVVAGCVCTGSEDQKRLIKFWLTQGEVVALDRIRNKIDRILDNAKALQLRSIKAFCFNGTRAVSSDAAPPAEGTCWSFLPPPHLSFNNNNSVLQNLPTLRKVSIGSCWMLPAADWDRGPTWGAPGA